MKKFLALSVFCLFMPLKAHAFQTSVWLSTNTNVGVSTYTLCGQYVVNNTTTTLRGVLHGVCVNTAATGNVTVFGSTYSFTTSISGVYSTATQVPCNFYDVDSGQGLSFNKNGLADVSILYQCY